MLSRFLQNFGTNSTPIGLTLGVAGLIGLVGGGVPAWKAARIRIVDGLRRVAGNADSGFMAPGSEYGFRLRRSSKRKLVL